MTSTINQVRQIITFAGSAIALGFADEIVALHEVLSFDMRFNLRHPKQLNVVELILILFLLILNRLNIYIYLYTSHELFHYIHHQIFQQ